MNPVEYSLSELIEACTDHTGADWQKAWNEFLNRYKNLIYYFIITECHSWHFQRLQIQVKDIADDIFSEVINLLMKNLATYDNRKSEMIFISWINVICLRATRRHLNSMLDSIVSNDDVNLFQQFKTSQTGLRIQELYENLVNTLRIRHNKRTNRERDIHIFLLKFWSGFPVKQILMHPVLTELTETGIGTIINRMKKKLKNSFFL
jgi:hypothetical protein